MITDARERAINLLALLATRNETGFPVMIGTERATEIVDALTALFISHPTIVAPEPTITVTGTPEEIEKLIAERT